MATAPEDVSAHLELEQAHALLDRFAVPRIEVDSLMLLSLKGRIELLLEKVQAELPPRA